MILFRKNQEYSLEDKKKNVGVEQEFIMKDTQIDGE